MATIGICSHCGEAEGTVLHYVVHHCTTSCQLNCEASGRAVWTCEPKGPVWPSGGGGHPFLQPPATGAGLADRQDLRGAAFPAAPHFEEKMQR